MIKTKCLLSLFAFGLSLGISNASPVLDQSQLQYDGGLSARTLPGYTVWQSFTDGVTGSLKEVDLALFPGYDSPKYAMNGGTLQVSGSGTLQVFGGVGTGGNLLQSLTVTATTLPQGTFTWNNWCCARFEWPWSDWTL